MSNHKKHIILETHDLSIGYSDKKTVHQIQGNINLKLYKGELIAVLGKNGIGKSTLLRTLTKVQNALSGSILLDGENLERFDLKALSKKIGLVLTERLPESQLTVFELIALGRQPYTNWIGKLQNEDVEKIHWAMGQTDTKELANKHFYELSDGQLQRVMIARALAQDTEIIMLDEPTAHLDMHHTIKIFQLLEKLVKETHKTIITTSHQVNLAIQSANRIILLTDKEVDSGSREELIERNSFDQLFPAEIINFNAALEQFVINKKS
ncbi:ABC transporter ATP-binding protein [Pseudotenacibaculum sp. MALMAid0570]|uniref:ABC transporter ATP-binding protein n=1 Tax=Pseudotenacibaculum sp. MALMAid0570 TaxID=3143938 RepID=UPI0032DF367F